MLLAEHMFLHESTLLFIFALAGFIISAIMLVTSRFTNLTGWGLGVVSLVLVAEYWPT